MTFTLNQLSLQVGVISFLMRFRANSIAIGHKSRKFIKQLKLNNVKKPIPKK